MAIAQDIIHQNKKIKENNYMQKLNFEKTYDMVDWNCIAEVLKHQGLGRNG